VIFVSARNKRIFGSDTIKIATWLHVVTADTVDRAVLSVSNTALRDVIEF